MSSRRPLALPWRVMLQGMCVMILLLSGARARASGFAIMEQGAASSALGGAATARGDLAEAAFYNPAAAPSQRVVGINATLLSATLTHSGQSGRAMSQGTSVIPAVHGMWGSGAWGASVSFGAPFGSRLSWDEGWEGRYEATASTLRALELAPSASARPLAWLALAAGPRLQQLQLGVTRAIDTVDAPDGRVALQASGWHVGWQVAALIEPLPSLRVGLTYRSAIHQTLRGIARFEAIPVELQSRARDGDLSSAITTPDRVAMGVAYAYKRTTLSLDLERLGWGAVDQITFDFDDPQVSDVTQQRRWSSTITARAGIEHRLMEGALALRLGGHYDPSPVPAQTLSPTSPDSARWGFALGAGYALSANLSAALSVSLSTLTERVAENPDSVEGSYQGRLVSAALGATWSF